MSRFRIERTVALPPAEVWRRITDWPAHGARIPFTSTTVLTPDPSGVGTRFTARTGLGRRLGFDDPMEVVRFEPPGSGPGTGVCGIVKLGRAVRGSAVFEVYEVPGGSGGPAASRVVWTEELRLRGVPGWCDPVLAAVGRRLFARALDGLLGN
ncbi:SRPBCC family protein [Streptomyces sp. NPDC090025]|uniref:SRPBCC family protein n=1 Tax=Streptomyces sp. NPDC090025 TaxID=3365922 RepID=UPI003836AB1A